MAFKAIEILIVSEINNDVIVGSGPFGGKIQQKTDRNTHMTELTRILEAGCSANGLTMTTMRRNRRTFTAYGDVQVIIK
ncbi:MAG: hypothetical protein ABIF11_05465 [Nitrospirota bacterium]|uniref:Uncharacterized protein n=1 Tax=viral metagenome TaxID=1070528 RepID=A0A6M3L6D0_9ZZZZ